MNLESFCDGRVKVAANVTGKEENLWRSWGKINPQELVPTQESLYEIFERAGVAFTPLRRNVFLEGGILIPNVYVVQNPVTDEIYGIVSESYCLVSHWETVAGILPEILEIGAIPGRVISLDEGGRIHVQFFIGKFEAARREHNSFLTISNGIDGKTPLKVGFSTWTPVCWNTYASSLRELNVSLRHTSGFSNKLYRVRNTLKETREDAVEFFEFLDKLYQQNLETSKVKSFADILFGETKNNAANNRKEEFFVEVEKSAQEVGRATAYDLFGGLTRYVWERAEGKDGEKQYEYVTSGAGKVLVDRGIRLLRETYA